MATRESIVRLVESLREQLDERTQERDEARAALRWLADVADTLEGGFWQLDIIVSPEEWAEHVAPHLGDTPGERPIREARLEEENLGQARASLNFTLAELQTAQRDLRAARAALREVLEEPVYQSREVLDRWRRALGDAPGEGAR